MSQEAKSSRKVKQEEEEDLPKLVDESEEERKEEEATKKRRVQELLEKCEALQIHRKVLGIVHIPGRSKMADEERKLRTSIKEAELAVKILANSSIKGAECDLYIFQSVWRGSTGVSKVAGIQRRSGT